MASGGRRKHLGKARPNKARYGKRGLGTKRQRMDEMQRAENARADAQAARAKLEGGS